MRVIGDLQRKERNRSRWRWASLDEQGRRGGAAGPRAPQACAADSPPSPGPQEAAWAAQAAQRLTHPGPSVSKPGSKVCHEERGGNQCRGQAARVRRGPGLVPSGPEVGVPALPDREGSRQPLLPRVSRNPGLEAEAASWSWANISNSMPKTAQAGGLFLEKFRSNQN